MNGDEIETSPHHSGKLSGKFREVVVYIHEVFKIRKH